MVKIKATIITGFLGSGKTTFINALLQKYPDIKFALVENEFGDVAIDTKLIRGVDAGKMFELKDGCICCTITNEYELILLELAERFPDVDHLIIETTGIADPVSVIRPFFADKDIKDNYDYSGTVCLVDSVNFENNPEKEISLKQMCVADLIILNKCDLINESKKVELHKKLTSINPMAEVLIAESGIFSEFNLNALFQANQNRLFTLTNNPIHAHLQSQTLFFVEPLDKEKFTEWLEYNLDIYKNQIYRVKGILYFIDEPFQYILQGVGSGFEITEGGISFDSKSKVVFIGKLENVKLEFS